MLHMIMVIVYLYDDGSNGRKNKRAESDCVCVCVRVRRQQVHHCVSSRDQQNVIEICVCLCAHFRIVDGKSASASGAPIYMM